MKILILLLFMCQTSYEKTIFVAVDNSVKSKMLKLELTRDWTSGKMVNDTCYVLDNKKTELSKNLKIVDIYNSRDRNEYQIPSLETYPQYRVGLYKRFEKIPDEAFVTTSYPLLTVITLRNNMLVDEIEWKRVNNSMVFDYKFDYVNAVYVWLYENQMDGQDKNEIGTLIENNSGYGNYELVEEAIKKYGNKKGFPKFDPPEFMQNPVLKFPWEQPDKEIVIKRFSDIVNLEF